MPGDCQDTKRRRQSSTLQQGLLGVLGIKELAGENCLESPESMNQHQSAKVAGPIFFQQSQKLSCTSTRPGRTSYSHLHRLSLSAFQEITLPLLRWREASREMQVKDTNSSFDHCHRALLLLYPTNTSWYQEADYSLLKKAHVPPRACS